MLNLLKNGLYACGTLRLNRKGFPEDLKTMAKKGSATRGESKTRQCDKLTITVWQDTKPVLTIATNSDPTVKTTALRKQKDGTHKEIESPQSIELYNKYMGGVYHNDQLRHYYAFRLKGRKNYKYLFWFVLDVSSANTYILLTKHTDLNVKCMKTFHVQLAQLLIAPGRDGVVLSRYHLLSGSVRPTSLGKEKACTDVITVTTLNNAVIGLSGFVQTANYFYAIQGGKMTVFIFTTLNMAQQEKTS